MSTDAPLGLALGMIGSSIGELGLALLHRNGREAFKRSMFIQRFCIS